MQHARGGAAGRATSAGCVCDGMPRCGAAFACALPPGPARGRHASARRVACAGGAAAGGRLSRPRPGGQRARSARTVLRLCGSPIPTGSLASVRRRGRVRRSLVDPTSLNSPLAIRSSRLWIASFPSLSTAHATTTERLTMGVPTVRTGAETGLKRPGAAPGARIAHLCRSMATVCMFMHSSFGALAIRGPQIVRRPCRCFRLAARSPRSDPGRAMRSQGWRLRAAHRGPAAAWIHARASTKAHKCPWHGHGCRGRPAAVLQRRGPQAHTWEGWGGAGQWRRREGAHAAINELQCCSSSSAAHVCARVQPGQAAAPQGSARAAFAGRGCCTPPAAQLGW